MRERRISRRYFLKEYSALIIVAAQGPKKILEEYPELFKKDSLSLDMRIKYIHNPKKKTVIPGIFDLFSQAYFLIDPKQKQGFNKEVVTHVIKPLKKTFKITGINIELSSHGRFDGFCPGFDQKRINVYYCTLDDIFDTYFHNLDSFVHFVTESDGDQTPDVRQLRIAHENRLISKKKVFAAMKKQFRETICFVDRPNNTILINAQPMISQAAVL